MISDDTFFFVMNVMTFVIYAISLWTESIFYICLGISREQYTRLKINTGRF